jgi:hypothetical protein
VARSTPLMPQRGVETGSKRNASRLLTLPKTTEHRLESRKVKRQDAKWERLLPYRDLKGVLSRLQNCSFLRHEDVSRTLVQTHSNLHVEARNAAAIPFRTSLESTVSHAISLNPMNFHPTFQKKESSRSMRDRRGDFGGNKRLEHGEPLS